MANKALWIFPNFYDTITVLPEEDQAAVWQAICEYGLGYDIDISKLNSSQQICIKALEPLLKLRNTGGSINGVSNNPSGKRKNPEEKPTLAPTLAPTVAPTLYITGTGTRTRTGIYTSTSEGGLPPTEEIISGWNSVARKYHLSTIKTLDERRLRSFRQRYEQSGVSNLAEFFALIDGFLNDSLFLQGKRMCKDGNDWVTQDTDWRADFDFFLQRKSFTKALEGGYDDPTVRKFKEAKHATTEK